MYLFQSIESPLLLEASTCILQSKEDDEKEDEDEEERRD